MLILPTYGTIPARDRQVAFAGDLILLRDKNGVKKAVCVSGWPSLPYDNSVFGLDA
jgi:hypothetical protein